MKGTKMDREGVGERASELDRQRQRKTELWYSFCSTIPLSQTRAMSEGSIISWPLGSSNCSGPVHLRVDETNREALR